MVKRTPSESSNNCKNIAITIGDVGGVGPEIIVKAIDFLIKSSFINNLNLFVIGSKEILEKAIFLLNLKIKINVINNISECKKDFLNVYELDSSNKNFTFNETSQINGEYAYKSIIKAIELAKNNKVQGVVTAPISKKGLRLAGINFPGHTEIFAKFTNTRDYRMMFVGKKLKVILHTIHIPLKDVSKRIDFNSLRKTILIGKEFLKKFLKISSPLIYVAGLNPHAGENGLIGNEEKKFIFPLIKKLKEDGLRIEGPIPADTVFFKAINDNADLVVALYHDQGLIPVKTIDFFGTINITCGIPFLRTSPDHGTAFDIAWKGLANPQSMINAIKFAITSQVE